MPELGQIGAGHSLRQAAYRKDIPDFSTGSLISNMSVRME